MKNKSDASKSESAPLSRKKKGAEFKPFWQSEAPSPTAKKSSKKGERPEPAAQKTPSRADRSASAASPASATAPPHKAAKASQGARPDLKKADRNTVSAATGSKLSGKRAGVAGTESERQQHQGSSVTGSPGTRGSKTAAAATGRKPEREETAKRHDKPNQRTEHSEHRPHHKATTDSDQRPKLHSGKILEVSINGTTSDGFGVAAFEGNRLLVAGGIQGEQLLVKVTYVGRRESFANIMRCIKASPDRESAPACQMGKCCDGCGLMQMHYPAQLAWKKQLVTREIYKFPSLGEAKIFDTLASPKELNYRNSAKLVVAGKHLDPVIGIYRRNTHDVLEIDDCPLHHPLINKVVKATKAGIKRGKVPIYNAKSEMGLLRYLVVRVAEPSDKVMVVFVTSEQGYSEMHHLAKFVQQAVPEVTVVAQNINNSTGNVIFGQKERFITKTQTLHAKLGNKTFTLSPHSFFQVNSGAARIIYEKVRELAKLTGKERVLDVYCGIGGISLFLADQAAEVVGIEYVESAVADATLNAALNRADNCTFEAGDAAHLIDEIGEEGGADLIVLNPPRKGCDEKVLKSVAGIRPARIIYVSCSPDTLSRDLDMLTRLGYRTLEVHPVDMFPQTVHVEDVALLERIEQ